jgi:hypothetical protein
MKKIIAILLALAVVSMAFAQTVSISNTLSITPQITVDGGVHYWGFADDVGLREQVTGEAITADGRAKVKGIIRFDVTPISPNEKSILSVKPRWSWGSAEHANDGNRSRVAAVLKPFDFLEVGVGNLENTGYAMGCGPCMNGVWGEAWEYGFATINGIGGQWQHIQNLVNDGIYVAFTGVENLKIGVGLASASNGLGVVASGDNAGLLGGNANLDTMLKKGLFHGLAIGASYNSDMFAVGANWKGNFGLEQGYTNDTNDKSYQDHTIYAGLTFKGLQEAKIGTTLEAAVGFYTAKASTLRKVRYYDWGAKQTVDKTSTPLTSFLFMVGAGFDFRNGISDNINVLVGYNKIGGTASKVLPFGVTNKIAYSVNSDAKFAFTLAYIQNGLTEKKQVAGATNTNNANYIIGEDSAYAYTPAVGGANDFGWLIGAKPEFSWTMGAHSFNMGVKTVVKGQIVPHAKSGWEWGWTGLKGTKAIVEFPLSWTYTF